MDCCTYANSRNYDRWHARRYTKKQQKIEILRSRNTEFNLLPLAAFKWDDSTKVVLWGDKIEELTSLLFAEFKGKKNIGKV